jgi:hypothetical protein
MPIFGWEEGEVKPTDPPYVRVAEKHLSDGHPGGALIGLGLMGIGATMVWVTGPVGVVPFVVGVLICLASMPRTIRRWALVGGVLGIISVLIYFAG